MIVSGPFHGRMHPSLPAFACPNAGTWWVPCISSVSVPGSEVPAGSVCRECARISSWQQLANCRFFTKCRKCVLCYQWSYLFVSTKSSLTVHTQTQTKSGRIRIPLFLRYQDRQVILSSLGRTASLGPQKATTDLVGPS